MKIESAGVPAVSIASSGFMGLSKAIAATLGYAHCAIAEFPGVPMTESKDSFRGKVESSVFDGVVEGLTRPLPVGTQVVAEEPDPHGIVLSGTLDQVQEAFLERGWSDGLPVIPPTTERVQRFLDHTDRDPDESLGLLLPARREALVRAVAVNGVMAGCRPEYMPILVAIAEVLADPRFRIEDAGSTPGWEPLVIVTGPLVRQLDFNFGQGAMRVGRQANSSVGRFTRLIMRNVAGLRFPPGATDKGTIAMNFNVALAEDEQSAVEIGWTPYRVERGYPHPGVTVVTIQSVVGISVPAYSGGDTAEEHLDTITRHFREAMGTWAYLGIRFKSWYPLVVISPAVAGVLAEHGYSKDDVRDYLYTHSLIEAAALERHAYEVGSTSFNLERLVEDGDIPQHYFQSPDPRRLVPMCYRKEWIQIVVSGDPARNQSRIYVQNHSQGRPVSRPVALSTSWAADSTRRQTP